MGRKLGGKSHTISIKRHGKGEEDVENDEGVNKDVKEANVKKNKEGNE